MADLITLPREVLEQAVTDIICGNTEYAITALRTALEAPAAQKVEPTDCDCATQLDCDGRCCMKAAPAAREQK